MKTIALVGYLFFGGLIIALVGLYMAVSTNAYMATITEAEAQVSIDLLSDIRGMGGLLLTLGAYTLIAAFRKNWRSPALLLSITVYMSFVVFRTLGFVVDGLPEMKIFLAYSIELIMALWGYLVLKKAPHSLIYGNKLGVSD